MSDTLRRNTTHPPDIEDRQVLEFPAPSELRALAFSDRFALKLGLWLMQRAQRPGRAPATMSREEAFCFLDSDGFTQRDALILLSFHQQHQLR